MKRIVDIGGHSMTLAESMNDDFSKFCKNVSSQCNLCNNEIEPEWAYYTNDHICEDCYPDATEDEIID